MSGGWIRYTRGSDRMEGWHCGVLMLLGLAWPFLMYGFFWTLKEVFG